jgi:hypothetical protein
MEVETQYADDALRAETPEPEPAESQAGGTGDEETRAPQEDVGGAPEDTESE